jgi:hypothetical protein
VGDGDPRGVNDEQDHAAHPIFQASPFPHSLFRLSIGRQALDASIHPSYPAQPSAKMITAYRTRTYSSSPTSFATPLRVSCRSTGVFYQQQPSSKPRSTYRMQSHPQRSSSLYVGRGCDASCGYAKQQACLGGPSQHPCRFSQHFRRPSALWLRQRGTRLAPGGYLLDGQTSLQPDLTVSGDSDGGGLP